MTDRYIRLFWNKLALLIVVSFAFGAAGLLVNPTTAHAATNDPRPDGWYRTMELVNATQLQVLAKPGETIHFAIEGGESKGDASKAPPAAIEIWSAGGTTFLASKTSTGAYEEVTYLNDLPNIVYNATTPETSFVAKFASCTQSNSCSGDNIQAYEWRVWVTDSSGNELRGRVYWDGMRYFWTWQRADTGMDLDTNRANFKWRYVRQDGYRYEVFYDDFQGIFTRFGNSVYPNSTKPDNRGFAFVDCWDQGDDLSACPNEGDISYFPSEPITGNGSVADGTPIAAGDNSYTAPNTSFHYTGYNAASNQLYGGTVYVPFNMMQSGKITISVFKNSDKSALCSASVSQIDEPHGSGLVRWTLRDSDVTESGYSIAGSTYDIAAGCPGIESIGTSDTITIVVQPSELGRMSWEDHDTESRIGLRLRGNGLTYSSISGEVNSNLIWSDGYSRAPNKSCSNIPSYRDQGNPSGADSQPIPTKSGNTVTGNLTEGAPVPALGFFWNTALGTAHGWTSNTNCDAQATQGTKASSWGNDRDIIDWTYAFRNPNPSRITIGPLGGPTGYELTPNASISPSPVVPGDSVSVARTVNNKDTTSAAGIQWDFSEAVFDPGVTVTEGLRNGSSWVDPCSSSGYFAAASTCSSIASVPGQTFDPGSTNLGNYGSTLDTSTIAIGSHICYSLAVTPYTSGGGSNFNQYITCAVVAASPYMSVIGGDVWAGGLTGTTDVLGSASYRIGSFGEYGVFATGKVDYFGSAARLGIASTMGKASATDGARLTFGSYDTTLGNFSTSHKISDLVASLCPTGLHSGSPPPLGGTYTTANDDPVCYDTVRITSDITYASATSFAQLPSLTIVANTILIDGDVKEIAGNFYAVDKFVTCDEGVNGAGGIIVNKLAAGNACDHSLVINGSVTVASQDSDALVLNRSFGGTTTGQPAEVIRMRPEVYLTPFTTSLQLQTVNETELPPRY